MQKNMRCIVTTNNRFMIIYEILYILGLTFILIGAILEYYFKKDGYFIGSIIDASVLFILATILWAIDRKCEPISKKGQILLE